MNQYEWDDENKKMHCKKCDRDYSSEGCDMAFGCMCSAHHHIEYHDNWDIVAANPGIGKMTANQFEGRSIDR